MSDTDSASSTPPSDPLPSPEPRWSTFWKWVLEQLKHFSLFKVKAVSSASGPQSHGASGPVTPDEKQLAWFLTMSKTPLGVRNARHQRIQYLIALLVLVVFTSIFLGIWKRKAIVEYFHRDTAIDVTEVASSTQSSTEQGNGNDRENPNNAFSPRSQPEVSAQGKSESNGPMYVPAPEARSPASEKKRRQIANEPLWPPAANEKPATSASSVSSTPTRQVAQASAPATSSARALSQTAAVTVPAPVLPQEEKAKQKSGSDCDCSGRQAASQRVVPPPVATDTYSCSRRSASGKLLHVNCGRGKPIVLQNGDITCQSKNYLPPATEKVCYGVQG